MKVIILFCSLLIFLPTLYGQKLHFRTDGFYCYDNKCDTIYVVNLKDNKSKKLKGFFDESSYVVDDTIPYLPRHCIQVGGRGSMIDVIAFFSDYIGAYSFKPYWDKNRLDTLTKRFNELRNRKQKLDNKGEYIHANNLKNDNSFTLSWGFDVNTNEVMHGILYADRIVLKEHVFGEAPNVFVTKAYRFYKNGEVPRTRNKFIYRYVEAFSNNY